MRPVRVLAAIVFWVSASLLTFAQVGYPLALWLRERLLRGSAEGDAPVPPSATDAGLPSVTLIVAAYREADVIAAKVANARALDYPQDRLSVVVSCDGSPDDTAARARAAGADLVLENPRGGKIASQDAAVARASTDVVAFSDANAQWEPDALRRLVAPFADPQVGYVCGNVTFTSDPNDPTATNQEGVYWRYEMWLRAMESRLHSVTGGNGAIYATRREAYVVVDPIMGHDLSFPFTFVQNGWRAVYAADARARELMVPSIEGEFARKRRMMSHAWPIVLRGGLLRLGSRAAAVRLRALRPSDPAVRVAVPAPEGARRRCGLGAQWRGRRVPPAACRSGLAARRGGRRRPRPAQAVPHRQVLRAHHRVDRVRADRPSAPRHAGRLVATGGHPLMREPLRRVFDVVVAGTVLLLSGPVVALAALLIRLESPGGVIYRQRRVGQHGHESTS